MKINEIRREVCKRASMVIKNGYPRKWAFKWAWERVKKELNQIKATDLKVGDKVRIEFGDFGNVATVTVKSIRAAEEWYRKNHIIVVFESCGNEHEFCAELTDRFDRAA